MELLSFRTGTEMMEGKINVINNYNYGLIKVNQGNVFFGNDVGNDLPDGKAAARGQSHGHRRIEMGSRNVTDRIGHRHHGKAKGQRHAK